MTEAAGIGPGIKTPVGDAPVIPLILIGTGMYLAWFGVHYWRTDTKWPTDPVKAVLQGKPVTTAAAPQPESATLAADIQSFSKTSAPASGSSAKGGLGSSSGGDTAAHGESAQGNQNTGKLLAAAYGWSPAQNDGEWNSLVKLWNQESGWNNLALNASSGAFGIAQALGHGGSGTSGKYGNQYPSKAANDGDPTSQINWGLDYIKQRYGDPSAAWAHEVSNNWY